MDADYVENIIRNIDKQSYKCILVDGAWGIGKSYIRHAFCSMLVLRRKHGMKKC